MRQINQGAAANVMVLLVAEADHITGLTGATLTVTASKDGAAFAAITPTVTERGSGWYSLALTGTDTDTLGDLAIHVTATGADPCDLVCRVIPEVSSAVWSRVLETYTAEELMRLQASVLLGKVSGAGTGTEVFRDLADTKARITVTVDSNGNRTAVTRDGT